MYILRRASIVVPLHVGIFIGFTIAMIFFSNTPATKIGTAYSNDLQSGLQTKALDISNPPWSQRRFTNFFNKTLTLNDKGVISKVHGGIGNQLYHYACAYAISRDLNRPLFNFVPAYKLDSHRKFRPYNREFALDKFQIPLTNLIDDSTIYNKTSVTYITDFQLLFRTYPTESSYIQLKMNSFCQSEAYWAQYKDEIISMFQLKPEIVGRFPEFVINLGKEIEILEDSVAVHVRRGDVKSDWRLPISFQRESIVNISQIIKTRRKKQSVTKPKFFIFSDDIEYCRQEMRDLNKVHDIVYVSHFSGPNSFNKPTTSLQDFYLMAKCKHFIIPNSTFGWWVAYLGTQKKQPNGPINKSAGSIVIVSANRPAYWKSHSFKNKKKLHFYYNVIQETVQFPNEWVIYHPLS